jgi:hypothetical protein
MSDKTTERIPFDIDQALKEIPEIRQYYKP